MCDSASKLFEVARRLIFKKEIRAIFLKSCQTTEGASCLKKNTVFHISHKFCNPHFITLIVYSADVMLEICFSLCFNEITEHVLFIGTQRWHIAKNLCWLRIFHSRLFLFSFAWKDKKKKTALKKAISHFMVSFPFLTFLWKIPIPLPLLHCNVCLHHRHCCSRFDSMNVSAEFQSHT